MSDRWNRVHPALPLVLFGPAVVVSLSWGLLHGTVGLGHSAALLTVGLLSWTLAEYVLHRAVFHYQPKTTIGQRLHWLVHGYHHAHPDDGDRVVVAPWASVPLAVLLYAAFTATLGDVGRPLFGGFALGYVAYDTLHHAFHHRALRGTRLGLRLKAYHLRHHFRDDGAGFGVTTDVWDRVFGTRPQPGRGSTRLRRR